MVAFERDTTNIPLYAIDTMTSFVKGNYTNRDMLQEALKTGRAFEGGWRKLENKLSVCLGVAGKQQLSYSNVNIFFIIARIHHLYLKHCWDTSLSYMAACKIARLSSLCYVGILCDCFSNGKIDSQTLVSGPGYLFILQVLNQHIPVKSSRILQIFEKIITALKFWKAVSFS